MDRYILHIETATKICSIALSKNGKLLSFKETDESAYVHAEVITLFIEDVLAAGGIKASDLSAVSVTSGPGSYTGLRIGVSTAKGLCYALSIPLISIDALENLAHLAAEKHAESKIAAMIDARRMEVFSTIYDEKMTICKPVSADVLDKNSYSQFEPFIAVGDGAMKMKEVWKNRAISFDDMIKSSACGHVQLAFERFSKGQFEDVAYFEPFYLKDFISTSKK